MSKHRKSKSPNDGKNLYRRSYAQGRFFIQSGQSSIHGDTTYEVETSEAQSFAFHASTGEGASEGGGPGTGKAVLYTPGQSCEVLGEGLKVRESGDVIQLPAKIIKCKRGDTIIECENGDITLRGRNINIEAVGGGQDGIVNINGNRIIDLNAPDIRLQAEKILIDGKINVNIISNGFFQLRYGFAMAAAEADMNFGAMANPYLSWKNPLLIILTLILPSINIFSA
jgi:hypothetical protein